MDNDLKNTNIQGFWWKRFFYSVTGATNDFELGPNWFASVMGTGIIALYVEDGDLRVEMGKNRKVRLETGESVYFDGSLGYIFTNPGTKPAKLLVATYPAIIF